MHPSAQAKFGRILQDLSSDLGVQIIATTHSAYMLNNRDRDSNILLERAKSRTCLRETRIVDISQSNWLEPFSFALGLTDDSIRPWNSAVFSAANNIILVEGDTDKEYFELLRDKRHGDNALKFSGEIHSYGGADNLSNQSFLGFLLKIYNKTFITFDLDKESSVTKTLTALKLKPKVDFLAIGKKESGLDRIEGLLPENVRNAVHSANSKLVAALGSSDTKARRNAMNDLKHKYLLYFKENMQFNEEWFCELYAVARTINKAMHLKR